MSAHLTLTEMYICMTLHDFFVYVLVNETVLVQKSEDEKASSEESESEETSQSSQKDVVKETPADVNINICWFTILNILFKRDKILLKQAETSEESSESESEAASKKSENDASAKDETKVIFFPLLD